MGKILTHNEIKPLVKEILYEMLRDNKEEFREMITEAIEDIALANAVKDGRKNEFVSEKKIMKILEK